MQLFNGAYWSRAIRNPVVLAGLIVDLAPIFAVLFWGWRAAPLVMLYWMENLVIGVMTVFRMLFVAAAKNGPVGLAGGLFLSAFFCVHYGLFCLVHGGLITSFLQLNGSSPASASVEPFDIGSMIKAGLNSGEHVVWVLSLVAGFHVFAFVYDFVLRGEWRGSTLNEEMGAPYGRIVVLHIGIFAGAAGLILLGDPMIGVLALIFARTIWGLTSNMKRSQKASPAQAALPPTPAQSPSR